MTEDKFTKCPKSVKLSVSDAGVRVSDMGMVIIVVPMLHRVFHFM